MEEQGRKGERKRVGCRKVRAKGSDGDWRSECMVEGIKGGTPIGEKAYNRQTKGETCTQHDGLDLPIGICIPGGYVFSLDRRRESVQERRGCC